MSILLITATVTPPADAITLARNDPAARLGDYLTALRFYLGQLASGVFQSIVFAENSNSDISALKAISASALRAGNIEFISFYGLDYPGAYGRAFGEMRLIDYCMEHSGVIRALGPDHVIWKVTGRYIIENIARLVTEKRSADFYCQCRNLPRRWADMYFMGWTKRGYGMTIAGSSPKLRQRTVFESPEVAFRNLIDEKAKSAKVLKRLPEPPRITGVRGWDNRRYETEKFKWWLRSAASRVAPWLWI